MTETLNQKNIEFCMVRPDLQKIPQFRPPEGFRMRTYEPGDEKTWVQIQQVSDNYNEVDLSEFYRTFGSNLNALEDLCFFLDNPEGETIGTSTAWYQKDFLGSQWGRVHWVAVLPEYQGQGLSKPLLTQTLNRLSDAHNRCYLVTSCLRIPAIHVYLKFGFHPFVKSERCEEGWDYVKKHLSHPLLDEAPLTPEDVK
ncbi:MAG: GNAT family N-acetyltransferase [Candidatus Omnitrophica bacterium]|nr:GNAT family N-acetyltransferase [Candidatus Omnitrophota bacterium]MCA9436578.1 GNAT family N-acetyltransferase [Candidatus Omnitrophota bacterium]MCA9440229.1 GNAT family N-acetyltransferase [Candidatus Omnitrophota bacterium]MCB9768217.1 GNAT family N-acetyltransferase [Candidatus Omnitrophota bacterium]